MTQDEEEGREARLLDRYIKETADRQEGDDMLLIVPAGTASDNDHRLLDRLREDYGYGVFKEYSNDYQAVYSLSPGFDDEAVQEES